VEEEEEEEEEAEGTEIGPSSVIGAVLHREQYNQPQNTAQINNQPTDTYNIYITCLSETHGTMLNGLLIFIQHKCVLGSMGVWSVWW